MKQAVLITGAAAATLLVLVSQMLDRGPVASLLSLSAGLMLGLSMLLRPSRPLYLLCYALFAAFALAALLPAPFTGLMLGAFFGLVAGWIGSARR